MVGDHGILNTTGLKGSPVFCQNKKEMPFFIRSFTCSFIYGTCSVFESLYLSVFVFVAVESNLFLKNLFNLFIFLFFGLCRVLVAAHRIFVEVCGISSFRCLGFSLVAALRLLSSCGAWVFSL